MSNNQPLYRPNVPLPKNDEIILRPSSAPPNLEVTNSIFANSTAFLFENGLMDIRDSPQYEKFYQNNQSKRNLPPPLWNSTELKSGDYLSLQNSLQSLEQHDAQNEFNYPAFDSPMIIKPNAHNALSATSSSASSSSSSGKSVNPNRLSEPRPMDLPSHSLSNEKFIRISPRHGMSSVSSVPTVSNVGARGSGSLSPIGTIGESTVGTLSPTPRIPSPGLMLHSPSHSPPPIGTIPLSGLPAQQKPSASQSLLHSHLTDLLPNLEALKLARENSTSPHPTIPSMSNSAQGLTGALAANSTTTNNTVQVCKYYLNGFCARGDSCNFIHNAQDAAVTYSPFHLQAMQQLQGQTKPLTLGAMAQPIVPSTPAPVPSGANPASPVMKTKGRNAGKPNRFSASHYENRTIQDCIGQICFICKDQQGCRFLQREIDAHGDDVTNIIFNEVIEHVAELIIDPFGNYLIQKLIDTVSNEKRLRILSRVQYDLVSISKNIHGTRAAQKLIELITSEAEVIIVRNAFLVHIVDLIEDLNGNHVVQKCLIKLDPNENQFIYDGIVRHLVRVATLRHGCCVLQRCFDFGTVTQQQMLINEILANATILVEDSFGNYVLQYVLDLDISDLALQLINKFEGQIVRMSKEKCSSNVIEKCMKNRNPLCTQKVLRELLATEIRVKGVLVLTNPVHTLTDLLQDPFGNYVLQTCLIEGAAKCPADYHTMVQHLSPIVAKNQSNSNTNKKISQLLNISVSNSSSATASDDRHHQHMAQGPFNQQTNLPLNSHMKKQYTYSAPTGSADQGVNVNPTHPYYFLNYMNGSYPQPTMHSMPQHQPHMIPFMSNSSPLNYMPNNSYSFNNPSINPLNIPYNMNSNGNLSNPLPSLTANPNAGSNINRAKQQQQQPSSKGGNAKTNNNRKNNK